LYQLLKNENSVLWVVESDGEVMGSCGIYPTDGLPQECEELIKFYLCPKARGIVIGMQ